MKNKAFLFILTLTVALWGVPLPAGAATNPPQLSSLTVSAQTASGWTNGWLSGFSAGQYTYSVSLPYSCNQYQLGAVTADTTATISVTVGSNAAALGSPVSFTGSSASVKVTVSSSAGSSVYTLQVTRAAAADTNANLSSLYVYTSSGGGSTSYGPAGFNPATTGYTVTLPNSCTSFSIGLLTSSQLASASLTVNNTAVTSWENIAFSGSSASARITVTAENGASTFYTIDLKRDTLSTDASLLSLSVYTSSGAFCGAQGFSPSQASYSLSLPYSCTGYTVQPAAAAPASSVAITADGTAYAAGATVPFVRGVRDSSVIQVTVTAESGAKQTYTVNITRAAISTDATLASLSLLAVCGGNSVPFVPGGFSPTAYSSSLSLPDSCTAFSVLGSPSAAASAVAVSVNGTSYGVGASIPFTGSSATVLLTVTAESGAKSTYTVNVTRAAVSTDNSLVSTGFNADCAGGPQYLQPTPFDSSDTAALALPNSCTGFSVQYVTGSPVATVAMSVNGAACGQGTSIGFTGSSATVLLTVTAESGAKRTYTIRVTRAPLSTNPSLDILSITGFAGNSLLCSVPGNFDPQSTSYQVTLPDSCDNFLIFAQSSHFANIQITLNGSPLTMSGPVPFTGSTAAVVVTSTAESGASMQYTVNITRAARSTDSTLGELSLAGYKGSRFLGGPFLAFSPYVTDYTVALPSGCDSFSLYAPANDLTAKTAVRLNGSTVSANDPIAFTAQTGTLAVIVTAESGASQTYTVHLTRAAVSTDNKLAVLALNIAQGNNLSGFTLAGFDPGVSSYTASLPFSCTAFNVGCSASADTSTVSVTANGIVYQPGDSIPFTGGTASVSVAVTAESGAVRTYTVQITRAAAQTTAYLNGVVLNFDNDSAKSAAYAFDPSKTDISIAVPSIYSSVSLDTWQLYSLVPDQSRVSMTVNGKSADPAAAVSLGAQETVLRLSVTSEDGSKTVTKNIHLVPDASTGSYAGLSGLFMQINTSQQQPCFVQLSAAQLPYTLYLPAGAESVNVTPSFLKGTNGSLKIYVNNVLQTGENGLAMLTDANENDIRVETYGPDGSLCGSGLITAYRHGTPPTPVIRSVFVNGADGGSFGSFSVPSGQSSQAIQCPAGLTRLYFGFDAPSFTGTAKFYQDGTLLGGGFGNYLPLSFSGSSTVIKTELYSPDGALLATYTFTLTHASSAFSDATPQSLGMELYNLSGGLASQLSFDPSQTSFTQTISTAATSCSFASLQCKTWQAAEISLNGTVCWSATPDVSADRRITLGTGSNVVKIIVTAQDGTKKTYTITLQRAAAPQSYGLTNLAVALFPDSQAAVNGSVGPVTLPGFDTSTTSYDLLVPAGIHLMRFDVQALNGAPVAVYKNGALLQTSTDGSFVYAPFDGSVSVYTFDVLSGSGAAKTYTVTVGPLGAGGVLLDKAALTLTDTTTGKLTATPNPALTNKTVSWSSSNPAVATVDSAGNVTALSAGTAVITAKTANGAYSAACSVTVQAINAALSQTTGYATGIKPGTTAAQLVQNLLASGAAPAGSQPAVTKAGAAVSPGAAVGTGMAVTVNGVSYTVVVMGDLDGDGAANALDLLLLKRNILGLQALTSAQTTAANVDGSTTGSISSTDLLKLKRALLGLDVISQQA